MRSSFVVVRESKGNRFLVYQRCILGEGGELAGLKSCQTFIVYKIAKYKHSVIDF